MITSRSSEIVSQDGSSKTHHLYTAQKFYKNENSEYNRVDLSMADASSNVGDISLSNTRVMSLGIRKDSNPEKFVGIRPDQTQSLGTNQLEFTIKKVIYDGVEQDIDLSKNEDIGDNRMDLGSLIVESTIHSVTQMSKYDGSHKDFIIEYELHLTGMSVTNNKYSSDYTLRTPVSFSSIDIGEGNLDYIWNYHRNNPLPDTDDKKITLMVGKFTGESILLGDKDSGEEFNDSSLSGYNTIDIGMSGSSVYLKNSIALCFSFQNIDEELYRIAINNTCEALDLTPLEDSEYPENTGQYLLNSDGDKVAGCHMGEDSSRFYIFINTEAISDSVKSLFKLKTFNNTGYLSIAMSDVKTSLDNKFSYSMDAVTLDSNYYEPNNSGAFIIDTGTDLKYKISMPRVFDGEFRQIGMSTFHSLKHESGDVYKYTKYLTTDGYLSRKLKDVRYIDGTTNLDVGSDARWSKVVQLTYAALRTAAGAGYFFLNFTGTYSDLANSRTTTVFNATRFNCTHSAFAWDTSSITDTVTSATFKLHANGSSTADKDTLPVKSDSSLSADNFASGDWLNLYGLTGTTYMNSSFASWATTYDNASSWTNSWGTSATYDWRSLTLNSTAHTDIKDDDIVQFIMLDNDMFTNSSIGSSLNNGNSWHGVDYASADFTPYLVVVTEEGEEEAVTYNATFFGANF
jgi:hypothetical protein